MIVAQLFTCNGIKTYAYSDSTKEVILYELVTPKPFWQYMEENTEPMVEIKQVAYDINVYDGGLRLIEKRE